MEGSVHSKASASSAMEGSEQGDAPRVQVHVLVCNICLSPPTDPVVSVCGHLFCWPCLYEWLHRQAQESIPETCPLCRVDLREDVSITPVYGTANPETQTGTSNSNAAAAEGSTGAMIPAGAVTIPKRPAPPFGSRLESLENLNDLGPDSSRFVFRSVALEEVEAWKAECERLRTLLRIYRGRLHALERQGLLQRGDRRVGRGHEETGSRSE